MGRDNKLRVTPFVRFPHALETFDLTHRGKRCLRLIKQIDTPARKPVAKQRHIAFTMRAL